MISVAQTLSITTTNKIYDLLLTRFERSRQYFQGFIMMLNCSIQRPPQNNVRHFEDDDKLSKLNLHLCLCTNPCTRPTLCHLSTCSFEPQYTPLSCVAYPTHPIPSILPSPLLPVHSPCPHIEVIGFVETFDRPGPIDWHRLAVKLGLTASICVYTSVCVCVHAHACACGYRGNC